MSGGPSSSVKAKHPPGRSAAAISRTSQTKGGKPKTVYTERGSDAGAKAREYLSLAKTAQEAAGRLLALVAMARYAGEGAVAQSARSYYQLPVPDHLTAKKRAERAEQREREAEREALRRAIADRIARGGELDADERSQLREEVDQAYEYWSPEARALKEQLDELDRQPAEAADGDREAEAEEVAEPEPR